MSTAPDDLPTAPMRPCPECGGRGRSPGDAEPCALCRGRCRVTLSQLRCAVGQAQDVVKGLETALRAGRSRQGRLERALAEWR